MKAKRQLVLDAVGRNPQAKDDDALLLAEVWSHELQSQGANISAEYLYKIMKRVSRAESITRARRKLHETGVIKYSEGVEKQRYDAFEQARNENSAFYVPLMD